MKKKRRRRIKNKISDRKSTPRDVTNEINTGSIGSKEIVNKAFDAEKTSNLQFFITSASPSGKEIDDIFTGFNLRDK